jgi:hypothetical protein
MPHRSLTLLLPLAGLVLAAAACQPAEDEGTDQTQDNPSPALIAEDAGLAWSATLEADWSPTHAVAVGDTVVVSSSWEIDEGTEITAYRPDGSVAWQDSGYGGALLAPVGDDQVLICDSSESWTVSVEDGSVVSEGDADDERCPVADDEAGIPVPRNDEAYTVDGNVLSVEAPGGSYDVTLEGPVDEIWGVDGGVVAFVDETDTVTFYR